MLELLGRTAPGHTFCNDVQTEKSYAVLFIIHTSGMTFYFIALLSLNNADKVLFTTLDLTGTQVSMAHMLYCKKTTELYLFI